MPEIERSPLSSHDVAAWSHAYELYLRGRSFPLIAKATHIPIPTLKHRAYSEDWKGDRAKAWEEIKSEARRVLALKPTKKKGAGFE